MSKVEFIYQAAFPLGKDKTECYPLTSDHISVDEFEDETILKVAPEALMLLAQQAFHDVSFMLRPKHQQQIASILRNPGASENDKHVALQFLGGSKVAARGVLPACQDTGTAIIMGKKGQRVWADSGDEAALSKDIFNTYIEDNLRHSQNAALDTYKEVNTGTNLPTQIDLYNMGGDEYKFLCMAKGGDSANKTYLYQETRVLLAPGKLKDLLVEKMHTLGTVTCPPYHIAFVIGDTSVGNTLKTMRLASAHYCDALPTEDNTHGQVFRGLQPEQELLEEVQKLGLSVQFGEKYFTYDIRVIHPPRHGASCPVGMGVSCSADRSTEARVNREGIWIEKLGHNPSQHIPESPCQAGEGEVVKVDLNCPVKEILAQPSQYPVSTRLSLSGTIVIGRDIAHARLKECIESGEGLPQYMRDHPIYHAGPTKTPAGYPSGSLGPATAGCTDSYVNLLQSHGGSMTMLTKSNHSQQVTDTCHKHSGFCLGGIGGPAAVLAQQSIKHLECVGCPKLGMEAI